MTPDQLITATGCTLEAAQTWAPALTAACTKYGFSTHRRMACFVGQLAVESGRFTAFSENLNYSANGLLKVYPGRVKTLAVANAAVGSPERIGNLVYSDRLGNGSQASGDGYKYRGRGPVQLTGRALYQAYQDASGTQVVSNPDLLLLPEIGADAAAWYCTRFPFKAFADVLNVSAVTKAVNGPAMLGLTERQKFTTKALAALGGV